MGRVLKRDELTTKPVSVSKDIVAAGKTLVEAQRAAARIREDAKSEIIDLAVHMAGKIVGEAARVDPLVLDDLYRQALQKMGRFDGGVVHIHPKDLEETNIETLARENGFRLEADPTIEKGGCRITAKGAEVDATVATALKLFLASLKG